EEPNNLRWIILIAYLMGLSIGVHLLNLLAIPAIAFVYYFKKYSFSWKGALITSCVSLVLLGLMQTVVIIWFVKLAAFFEKFFVNTLGMGFNSGVLFYLLLLIAGLVSLIVFSKKKGWVVVYTLTWSISVALLGYTSFATILIRSQAQTPMNENRPSNVFAFVSYLNREQYGDRPLFRGQYFNTKQSPSKPYTDGDAVYIPSYSVREKTGKEKLIVSCRSEFEAQQYIQANPGNFEIVTEYIDTGEKKASEPNYMQSYLFPRMYSSQGSHIDQYKQWADIENFKQIAKSGQAPTQGENLKFFFSYQVNWMYWRYFMWNFAGRQNDVQGHTGDFQDGNWKSGVSFIDEARLGNQNQITDLQKNNKANNSFYFIPFILGLLGLTYQILRHKQDAFIVGLLFLLT
ncbi:MAG: protein O-mannosyl-transferase family, partial [Bacteroidota bacterium]